MDKDGSLQVEWKEWRDYHFLNPHSHNIMDIIRFWKHSVVIFAFLLDFLCLQWDYSIRCYRLVGLQDSTFQSGWHRKHRNRQALIWVTPRNYAFVPLNSPKYIAVKGTVKSKL